MSDNEILKQCVEPLLAFYDRGRRILPWREEPTPYHVWVSEIMLQQTRVEAVKPYYDRFMKALPDIRSLSQAEEEKLLKLWEGLGYYNRVRNMKKAAEILVDRYGGEMVPSYPFPAGNRQLYGGSHQLHCIRDQKTCSRWKCTAGSVTSACRCSEYHAAVCAERNRRGASCDHARRPAGRF